MVVVAHEPLLAVGADPSSGPETPALEVPEAAPSALPTRHDLQLGRRLFHFLNGVSTGITNGQFSFLTGFNIASGFQAGINHLDFEIQDFGAPTAFRVDDLAGTADLATTTPGGGVPEPAAWAMMLLGFFGLGSALRARRPACRMA